MIVVGMDPGSVSGAYGALLDDPFGDGFIETGDFPGVDRQINPSALTALLVRLKPDVAVVEQVGAMPKQGVSSTFRFGVSVGIIHGVVAALAIPIISVTPTQWKRHFNLNTDKEKSRALAVKFWPGCRALDRKKDAGRAEALLIARWYMETHPKET